MRSEVVAVGALCLVQFVDVMGVTVVVTALPTMLTDLHAPASSATTVSTGYAMFFGGLLMLGARLGDRFGHRRTIIASFVGFAAASFLAASAGSVAVLVIARCLQGAAAAVSVPSALRLITTITAEGSARRRAVAAWSATGAAAGASGFIVGGVLIELASWRLIFWMNLPLVAILAVLILWAVPRDVDQAATVSLDVAGSATLIAAVMAVIVGTTLVPQPGRWAFGIALIVLAGALVAVLITIERRAADPVLPAAVLRLPTLRRGALAALLNTATTSSVLTLATLYLQDVRHLRPVAGAEALLPFSLAVIAGSTVAAPVLRHVRPARAVTLGLALIAVADGSLAAVADVGHALSISVAVAGAGIGLSSVAATTLGTDGPTAWRSAASGVLNTAAQLGTAIGIAILLLIAGATTGVTGHGATGPVIAWTVAGIVAAVGALIYLRPTESPSTSRAASSLNELEGCS